MVNTDTRQLDVTPNPRILQMLGEIAFDPWQCFAELIDNSIDAYLSATENDPQWMEKMGVSEFRIAINLPTSSDFDSGTAVVSIKDNGSGMGLKELENSVKAGFSGNAPLEKLGLFGMGFNIATARLGRLTKVKTTKSGQPDWLVIELDLDLMQKSGKFNSKIYYEPKEDDSFHGTIVEIHRLKTEFKGSLTSGGGRGSIKKQLSRVYSAILKEMPIKLDFAEYEIEPWEHCIWNKNREAVIGSGIKVSPFVEINHELPESYFCAVCWHWSSISSIKNEDECPACGSIGNLHKKKRIIRGWLGIQRYFDTNHYGIDFIRNGRVIEQLNKDCFYFENPNTGEREIEYPIDTIHWGGRIVGQIHIDFAQVDYQKTSFSKDRNEWKEVLDYLRGSSPLRPRIAEKLNLPENYSPLNSLYKVFRSGNRSGLRMLVPGQYNNPKKGDNADAAQWALKFHQADPEFQTDEKWWERILLAERAWRGEEEDNEEEQDVDPDNPFDDEDEEEADDGEEADSSFLEIDPELSVQYPFPDTSVQVAAIKIDVYRDTRKLRVRDLKNKPPLEIETIKPPNEFRVIYHFNHPAFTEFAETAQDYLLLELSHWFSTRQGGGDWTAGRIYKALKDEYQRAKKLDLGSLGQTASELIRDLKEHLASQGIVIDPNVVDDQLKYELTQDVMSSEGNIGVVDELLKSGEWIERVSDEYILPEIEKAPEHVLDEKFFKTSYSGIEQDAIKRETIDRLVGCLKDAIMIKKASGRQTTPDKSLLLRADAALNYLIQQRG